MKPKPDDSLNLAELVGILHQKFGLPKRFAEDILKEFLNTIIRQLKLGHKIKLRKFGAFEMRKSHGKLRPKFNPSKNFLSLFKLRRR